MNLETTAAQPGGDSNPHIVLDLDAAKSAVAELLTTLGDSLECNEVAALRTLNNAALQPVIPPAAAATQPLSLSM
jgi:hypothetical protein